MGRITQFNFADVPNWYVLCNNNHCPLREDCLRFLAGFHAPDNLEIATCVMPKTLKDDKCRWFEKKTIAVYATGFSHIYDCVMTKDYTTMRGAEGSGTFAPSHTVLLCLIDVLVHCVLVQTQCLRDAAV